MALPLFLALLVAAACSVLITEGLRQTGPWARTLQAVGTALLVAVLTLALVAVVQAAEDDDRGEVPRVRVEPDWLTYLTAFATILAAVLALASIIYSAMQARRAEKALLTARRMEFELTLLAEMSRQLGMTSDPTHLAGSLRALLSATAPDDELPVLRAKTGIQITDGCRARLAQITAAARSGKSDFDARGAERSAVVAAVAEEITAAIDRRLMR